MFFLFAWSGLSMWTLSLIGLLESGRNGVTEGEKEEEKMVPDKKLARKAGVHLYSGGCRQVRGT